jgi:hypothetical protein
MELYLLLKTAHVLLLATWFGVDLGVATCGVLLRDQGSALETRGAFGRLRRLLDLGPQLSSLLTVPVVVALLLEGRWTTLPPPLAPLALGAALLVAGGWAAVTAFSLVRPSAWRAPVAMLDLLIRAGLALAFLVPALFGGFGPGWLNAKAMIFGLLLLAMLWVRWVTRAADQTLAAIVAGEATPAQEAVLAAQFAALRLPVAFIWAGIIVNVVLAVFRVP